MCIKGYTRMNIVTWREESFEFNGQTVVALLRPLKRKHMLTLQPYLSKGKDVDMKDALEAMGEYGDIFTECVKDISGITIDGEAVTPDQLPDETALNPLAWQVVIKLISMSQLKEDDAKNSGGE